MVCNFAFCLLLFRLEYSCVHLSYAFWKIGAHWVACDTFHMHSLFPSLCLIFCPILNQHFDKNCWKLRHCFYQKLLSIFFVQETSEINLGKIPQKFSWRRRTLSTRRRQGDPRGANTSREKLIASRLIAGAPESNSLVVILPLAHSLIFAGDK
jgi:hypothetical protein